MGVEGVDGGAGDERCPGAERTGPHVVPDGHLGESGAPQHRLGVAVRAAGPRRPPPAPPSARPGAGRAGSRCRAAPRHARRTRTRRPVGAAAAPGRPPAAVPRPSRARRCRRRRRRCPGAGRGSRPGRRPDRSSDRAARPGGPRGRGRPDPVRRRSSARPIRTTADSHRRLDRSPGRCRARRPTRPAGQRVGPTGRGLVRVWMSCRQRWRPGPAPRIGRRSAVEPTDVDRPSTLVDSGAARPVLAWGS